MLNYAIHNADAHLKNFALIYTTPDDVALAPVYDILTVTAYGEYAKNIPGLTLEGKKVWACGKSLHKFATQRLNLSAQIRAEALGSVDNQESQMKAAVRATKEAKRSASLS